MQTTETFKPLTSEESLAAAREIGQAMCDANTTINVEQIVDPEFAARQELVFLLIELEKTTLRAKRLYEKKDQLEAQILERMSAGESVTLPDGRKVEVVDNFAGIDKKTGKQKNVCWGHGSVRRFDIQITPIKKPTCRKKK